MSISSAPISATRAASSTFSSVGSCPDGNAVATEATLTPLPRTRSSACGTMLG